MVLGSKPMLLTVGGTGSGLEIMRLLGRSYSALHPEITIKVVPSLGTAGGVRALQNDAIDLAIASRQLKDQEKEGVTGYFLGESPLVFVVHPATVVDDVTLTQVINIYSGKTTAWPDGTKIRRILRPDNDSDWQLMSSFSPDLAKSLKIAQETEGLFLAVTDNDAAKYLERIPGSFGPSTLVMILAEKRNVKILSFEGIQPMGAGISSITTGKYPLVKQYHLLKKIDASPFVDDFIEFIQSDQGRQIMAQFGIISVGEPR